MMQSITKKLLYVYLYILKVEEDQTFEQYMYLYITAINKPYNVLVHYDTYTCGYYIHMLAVHYDILSSPNMFMFHPEL